MDIDPEISDNYDKFYGFRRVTEVLLEKLPSALGDKPAFCDTCVNLEEKFMTPNVFCVQCDRKFCDAHRKV